MQYILLIMHYGVVIGHEMAILNTLKYFDFLELILLTIYQIVYSLNLKNLTLFMNEPK